MKKKIRLIILIVTLCVLTFSLYKVISYQAETHESTDLVKEVFEEYVETAENEQGERVVSNIEFAPFRSEYPDVVAWIFQDGTNINYPIAQSKDNEYYLRRLLNGEHNMNGTLFMDYRNAPDFSDFVTMVYGHNMKNGEMFATFPEYAKQEYYNLHPEMDLYTPDGNYKIKLFAGFLTDDQDEIYSFAENSLGAKEIFEKGLEKSAFNTPITTYNGEKIVILSTCSYEKKNSRFVLLGILEKV